MSRPPGEEARRVAHAIVCERQGSEWCHWSSNKDSHAHYCDTLTAAIQPYLEDIATLRADMNVIMEDCANLTEALETLREIIYTSDGIIEARNRAEALVVNVRPRPAGQPGRTE